MLDTSNPYATFGRGDVVANAVESERTIFIRRTYAHLAIAIAAFVGLEAALIKAFPLETLAPYLTGRWTWLIVLGGFMAVSWVARMWADSSASKGLQYAGLSLYVIAGAVVFLPLMALATRIDPNIPLNAGLITLTVFMGLTVFVFATKADFFLARTLPRHRRIRSTWDYALLGPLQLGNGDGYVDECGNGRLGGRLHSV